MMDSVLLFVCFFALGLNVSDSDYYSKELRVMKERPTLTRPVMIQRWLFSGEHSPDAHQHVVHHSLCLSEESAFAATL